MKIIDAMGNVTVKPLPPKEYLNRLLRYEENTGRLFWLARADGTTSRNFNSMYAGKEAFTSTDSRGYRHGHLDGLNYQAHRIIFKMVYGFDPDIVDHINGNPSDNRSSNLRNSTASQNSANSQKSIRSTSPYRGVSWISRDRVWRAAISSNMKKIHLGDYRDPIEAAKAYDAGARLHHGSFAKVNFK